METVEEEQSKTENIVLLEKIEYDSGMHFNLIPV